MLTPKNIESAAQIPGEDGALKIVIGIWIHTAGGTGAQLVDPNLYV